MIAICCCCIFLSSCNGIGPTGNSKRDSLNIYKDSLKKMQNVVFLLQKVRDSLVFQNNYWFDDIIAEDIKQKGIPDPEVYIVNDLLNRQELVPEKGILGGTMRFTNVKLLGDRWAIAEMDDGHILGYVILKYDVMPDKKLRWTIMDHYID